MRIFITLCTALLVVASSSLFATEQEDEMARMQKQMNQDVMSQEFLAEEPEKVDAYIKEAMKKNLKPLEYKGTHWQRGYTCHDLLRWSWSEYRDCRYYHHYYGRYYPYPY